MKKNFQKFTYITEKRTKKRHQNQHFFAHFFDDVNYHFVEKNAIMV